MKDKQHIIFEKTDVSGENSPVSSHMTKDVVVPKEQATQPQNPPAQSSPRAAKSPYEQVSERINEEARVLYSASAVFPFDFFPDKIVIREDKVDIVFHQFFFTAIKRSAAIVDISEVAVQISPFFASVTITSNIFVENQVTVKFLKRSAADNVKLIIEGLNHIQKDKIDISGLTIEQVQEKAKQLGQIR